MTATDLLLTYALCGIPAGLVLGMAVGPVAARESGWGGYGSFRRRAARLAHVAAVMLPLLSGFYRLLLGSLESRGAWVEAGARLFVASGVGLVLLLLLAAWRPRTAPIVCVPATGVFAATVAFAIALL